MTSSTPRPSVLLLGMFYSRGVPEFSEHKRGQGYRDAIRCQSLQEGGFDVLSLDDKHSEEEYYDAEARPGTHCKADFADARRMFQVRQVLPLA